MRFAAKTCAITFFAWQTIKQANTYSYIEGIQSISKEQNIPDNIYPTNHAGFVLTELKH